LREKDRNLISDRLKIYLQAAFYYRAISNVSHEFVFRFLCDARHSDQFGIILATHFGGLIAWRIMGG
jgi:hypothetical protein